MARAYGRTPWELVNVGSREWAVNLAAFRAGSQAEREARERAEFEARSQGRRF